MTHKCQAAAGHCTLHVSYDSNSNNLGVVTSTSTLAIDKQQCIVDPTTQTDVVVDDESIFL